MAYDDELAPEDTHPDSLDPEAPSAEDIERFDRDGAACPSCGSEVYDDAAICPVCSEILTEDTAKPKPLAIIVVGAVLLAFVLIYVL